MHILYDLFLRWFRIKQATTESLPHWQRISDWLVYCIFWYTQRWAEQRHFSSFWKPEFPLCSHAPGSWQLLLLLFWVCRQKTLWGRGKKAVLEGQDLAFEDLAMDFNLTIFLSSRLRHTPANLKHTPTQGSKLLDLMSHEFSKFWTGRMC